jgi:hypothetical protein
MITLQRFALAIIENARSDSDDCCTYCKVANAAPHSSDCPVPAAKQVLLDYLSEMEQELKLIERAKRCVPTMRGE